LEVNLLKKKTVFSIIGIALFFSMVHFLTSRGNLFSTMGHLFDGVKKE